MCLHLSLHHPGEICNFLPTPMSFHWPFMQLCRISKSHSIWSQWFLLSVVEIGLENVSLKLCRAHVLCCCSSWVSRLLDWLKCAHSFSFSPIFLCLKPMSGGFPQMILSLHFLIGCLQITCLGDSNPNYRPNPNIFNLSPKTFWSMALVVSSTHNFGISFVSEGTEVMGVLELTMHQIEGNAWQVIQSFALLYILV